MCERQAGCSVCVVCHCSVFVHVFVCEWGLYTALQWKSLMWVWLQCSSDGSQLLKHERGLQSASQAETQIILRRHPGHNCVCALSFVCFYRGGSMKNGLFHSVPLNNRRKHTHTHSNPAEPTDFQETLLRTGWTAYASITSKWLMFEAPYFKK